MKNDKGFSLVELIIIIAIIAIISGIMMASLDIVGGLSIKKTSNTLVAYLNKARTAAMSKKNNEVLIRYDSSNASYYIKIPGSEEQVKLAGKGTKIYYYAGKTEEEAEANAVLLDESLKLSFDRSSGAYNPLSPSDTKYVFKLTVVRGSRSRGVIMVPLTGKNSLE